MKSYLAKKDEIKRQWFLFDAEGKILGRLASKIAMVLMGKLKPIFTPHIDCGDFVVVINGRKIRVTGKKLTDKIYYSHSFYPGGLKERTLKEVLAKDPTRVIYLAVKRMLPKNKLGARMLKRLKIYPDSTHPHKAQQPIPAKL